jgi:hypothetical protein
MTRQQGSIFAINFNWFLQDDKLYENIHQPLSVLAMVKFKRETGAILLKHCRDRISIKK